MNIRNLTKNGLNAGELTIILGIVLTVIGASFLWIAPPIINNTGLEPQENISIGYSNHFQSVITKLNFIINDDSQIISIYYNILPTDKNGFLAIALPYQGTLESNNKKWYSNELPSGSTVIFTNVTCSSSCAADEDEFTFTISGKLDSFTLPNHNFQLPFSNGISSEVVDEFYEIANGTSYNTGWDKTSTSVQVTLNKKFDERISEPAGRLSLIPNENGGNNNVLNWNLDDGNTVFTIKYSDNESRELADFRLIWSGIGIGSGFSLIAAGIALVRSNEGLERLKKFVKVQRYMQDANTAFILKHYDIAKQSYDLASKTDPEDIDPILLAGNSFYEMKQYSDAIPYYEKILEKDPNHIGALNNIGACNAGLKNIDKAYDYYMKAFDINLNYLDTINNLGALALDEEFAEEALPLFDAVIDAEKETSQVLTNKGKALNLLKQYDDAIKCCDRALELDRKFTDALLAKGKVLHNQNDYKNAILCYEQILKLDPSKYECLFNQSLSYLQLDDYDKAIKFAREFLMTQSFHIDALSNLGISLAKSGDHNEAIKNYNIILDKEKNNKDALYNKGLSLMLSDRSDLAVPLFDEVLRQEPENVLTILNKGNCFMNMKKIPEAIEQFKKALSIDPTNSDAIMLKDKAERLNQS